MEAKHPMSHSSASAGPDSLVVPGQVPVIEAWGPARECGRMLGAAWAESLRLEALTRPATARPWWQEARQRRVLDDYAPHLPEIYRGMAEGAGVDERVPGRSPAASTEGCTSWAVTPAATLEGVPLSGQTKDTPMDRIFRYQVLRLRPDDAPAALTLTYPGQLFGHGFVRGGCGVYRNALFAGEANGLLPFEAWGLIALHCPHVEAVREMTRQYGVHSSLHCTVADEHGGILGVEVGRSGPAFLEPGNGIYVHANAVQSVGSLRQDECCDADYTREDSLARTDRLTQRLTAGYGHLTPQVIQAALTDHVNFPRSLCRHLSPGSMTTACIIADPTRGRLHVTRGAPCQNWPVTIVL